jgi:triose/dihydroxyacetone kinase / FAD-AMP lyase (cyclizing)
MGGTSGGLYSIFFSSLSKSLISVSQSSSSSENLATPQTWARSLELSLNSLYNYTRARPPSRTLVDPLESFIIKFVQEPTYEGFVKAVSEAKESAESTAGMIAKAGRAAYVEREKLKENQFPDAGAWGFFKLVEGIKIGLEKD